MKLITRGIFLLLLILAGRSTVFGEDSSSGDSSIKEDLYEDSIKGLQKKWLKIYYEERDSNRVSLLRIADIDSLYFDNLDYRDKPIPDIESGVVNLKAALKDHEQKSWKLESFTGWEIGQIIPTIYIDTDPYLDEITSKTDYTDATFRFIPFDGETEPIETSVSIRGRGNSSWFWPKKPYRLKFDKKQSIGNLNKAKSFVLISNYIDNTLMRHVIGFKIADILGMPYSNIPQPVNLVFNGKNRGSYFITNKVGINSGSVDIDEEEGILWEIDSNFDEDFRFKSTIFNLPCMLKDPDIVELSEGEEDKVAEIWDYWRNDLEEAFKAVKEGRWAEAFDAEQFVNYMLVSTLVQNGELKHPKSFFMYKESKDGKYCLGPIWDLDWAFGYSYAPESSILYNGCDSFAFFYPVLSDSLFREMFKEKLDEFCEKGLDELLTYIDNYSSLIRDSAVENALIWPEDHFYSFEARKINTCEFTENVEWVKAWILKRVELVKNHPNYSLY